MDVKLLAVGLALAFGSYAIKVGLALAAAGRGRLYWVILLAYGFFFALAAILGQLVIRHLSTFQALLKGGLFLHLGVALGLFFWGISLWDRGPAVCVLMLPCPFCLLTTVLALALFSHLTGLLPWECGAFAYGIFGTMVLLAALVGRLVAVEVREVMVAAGIFYVALLAFTPYWRETRKVYSLVVRTCGGLPKEGWWLAPLFLAVVFAGYWTGGGSCSSR